MRILVPYAGPRHPKVAAAAPDDAEWVDVGSDDHAYWRTMADWWAAGEAFMVLEHDVVCRPDVPAQFSTCPEPWCVFRYANICCGPYSACMEAWANMLGCTRFSAELIAAVPDAVSAITAPEHLDWHNLCDGIAARLRAGGYSHHWHEPPVFQWTRNEDPDFWYGPGGRYAQ